MCEKKEVVFPPRYLHIFSSPISVESLDLRKPEDLGILISVNSCHVSLTMTIIYLAN